MPRFFIPQDHPSFPGHFPDHPIVPGVLLLERVMAVVESVMDGAFENYALSNVKFLASVVPGDALCVNLLESTEGSCKFTVHIVGASGATESILACSGQLRKMMATGV